MGLWPTLPQDPREGRGPSSKRCKPTNHINKILWEDASQQPDTHLRVSSSFLPASCPLLWPWPILNCSPLPSPILPGPGHLPPQPRLKVRQDSEDLQGGDFTASGALAQSRSQGSPGPRPRCCLPFSSSPTSLFLPMSIPALQVLFPPLLPPPLPEASPHCLSSPAVGRLVRLCAYVWVTGTVFVCACVHGTCGPCFLGLHVAMSCEYLCV